MGQPGFERGTVGYDRLMLTAGAAPPEGGTPKKKAARRAFAVGFRDLAGIDAQRAVGSEGQCSMGR